MKDWSVLLLLTLVVSKALVPTTLMVDIGAVQVKMVRYAESTSVSFKQN